MSVVINVTVIAVVNLLVIMNILLFIIVTDFCSEEYGGIHK